MLRTVLTFAYIVVSLVVSIPFGLFFLLATALHVKPLTDGLLVLFAGLWARGVILCTGSRVRVEGLEKVPRRGKTCIVGNHQGDMDIILMLAYLPRVAGFVAKKETLLFPIINLWIIAIGGVFIDRQSPRKSFAAIRRGAENVAKGRAMILFPEGTRSRGRPMGPFHGGSLKLATLADAVIVPLTIEGTWRVWEEKKRIAASSLRVTFHDPIETAGLDPEARKALAERVRTVIASGFTTPDGTGVPA